MKRIAVFAGSFDPITRGHHHVIRTGLELFDEVIVAIGINSNKQGYFPLEKREKYIQELYSTESRIRVMSYEGLTVNFCQKQGARFILRGLRNGIDFEYEKSIAHMNKGLDPQIETVFLMTHPALAHIQSTIVREIHKNGGDISAFLPEGLKWT